MAVRKTKFASQRIPTAAHRLMPMRGVDGLAVMAKSRRWQRRSQCRKAASPVRAQV